MMKANEIVRTFILARLSVNRPCQLGRKLKEKRETRKKKIKGDTYPKK